MVGMLSFARVECQVLSGCIAASGYCLGVCGMRFSEVVGRALRSTLTAFRGADYSPAGAESH